MTCLFEEMMFLGFVKFLMKGKPVYMQFVVHWAFETIDILMQHAVSSPGCV